MEMHEKVIKDPVLTRIVALMEERGTTDKALSEYLGVGKGTISHWKYNRRSTYLQYINPICDFLETTPTYLFRGVQDEGVGEMTPSESEMIRNYRKVGKEGQNCVRTMLNLLAKDEVAEKTLL